MIPADLEGGVLNWAQAQAALADLHSDAGRGPAVLDGSPGRLRHDHQAFGRDPPSPVTRP